MKLAPQGIDRIGGSSSCPLPDFSQVEVAKYWVSETLRVGEIVLIHKLGKSGLRNVF